MGDFFRRKVTDELVRWKESDNGSTAALIEGPRRVGKTTVARRFAEENYRSWVCVDFSEPASEGVRECINKYSSDLDTFFLRLQTIIGVRLYERSSVIVFDDIQLFPPARQMIKRLVADGRYDYIETGSLISIRKNIEDILVPSEEYRIQMHPMDFSEFLAAKGDTVTCDLLRDLYARREPFGRALHESILEKYRQYMLVGGMPQAVDAYLRTNNFDSVERVKRNILDLYIEDAGKIKGDNKGRCRQMLVSLPSMLSKHEKTFSPSDIEKDSRTREYLFSVNSLGESRMVNICYRCSDPGPVMGMDLDYMSFKLYSSDTGLLFTSAFSSIPGSKESVYSAILAGKMNMNEGMFFENAVAQELTASGHQLLFAKFESDDSDRKQEVDFLITDGRKVHPIEVKSSSSSAHVSLDRFMRKFRDRTGQAYVVHAKDLREDGDILYIPIYMAMFL